MDKIILGLSFTWLSTLPLAWANIDYSDATRIIDNPPPDSTNIEFSFKDTDPSLEEPISEIDHKFWPKATSYLYLRDKQIAEAIQDFCKMQDVDVVISSKLQGKSQKVHQTFEKIYPAEIWDQLVKSCNLLWFHDGHVLFVYDTSEIETKIFKIHPHQIQPLLDLTSKLGFSSSNMGIQPMREGGIIVVSGAPKLIELLENMTSNMQFYKNIDMDTLAIRIFPLKHAWAEDKSIGNLSIPGISTTLKEILGKNIEEKSPITPTADGSAKKIKSVRESSNTNDEDNSKQGKETLPEGGLITTDTRQNAIIVKDYTRNLPLYENIIRQLDVPLELIEIEAVIVNVNKNCGLTIGLNQLDFTFKNSKESIQFQPIGEAVKEKNSFSLNWKGIVSGNEFLSAIIVLESQNHSKILARPSVITMDNLTAIMDQSKTYYLPIKGNKSGDLYSITGSTKLQVTPHLIKTANRPQIQLILDIKDESITPDVQDSEKTQVNSSSISTQAIVYEGQSVLIGGYFNEQYIKNNSGFPFLNKLPVVGNLFKNTVKNKGTSERLFLITPKLIRMSASEDKYEGLFSTPTNLMGPDERIHMEYLQAEKKFPEQTKPKATRTQRLIERQKLDS